MSDLAPRFVPVYSLTRGALVGHASRRGDVILADGRSATLIAWRTPERPTKARVQLNNARRSYLSVPADSVVYAVDPQDRPT